MDQQLKQTFDAVCMKWWFPARLKLLEMFEDEPSELDISRELLSAVRKFVFEKNASSLAEYLRPGVFLNSDEGEFVAAALEGKLNRSRGAPKDRAARFAVKLALRFYEKWQQENKQRGIDDYGLSNDMKDEAAKIVVKSLKEGVLVELREDLLDLKFSVVRDLMDRPIQRRK